MPLKDILRAPFAAYRRRTAFDLDSLSRRFAISVHGILHVGANMGQEAAVYDRIGARRVIWVEGFDEYYRLLKDALADYPLQEAHLVLVSDRDNEEVTFRIASNTGSSTAMIPGAGFEQNFNGVVFDRSATLTARRLDSYFREKNIDLANVNVLVLDVEGFELKVLRSLEGMMSAFDWAVCEVSLTSNFKDGPLVRDIDRFFLDHGFRRRALKCGLTSGDGLYERKMASRGDRLGMTFSRAWAVFAARSGLYGIKRWIGSLA